MIRQISVLAATSAVAVAIPYGSDGSDLVEKNIYPIHTVDKYGPTMGQL